MDSQLRMRDGYDRLLRNLLQSINFSSLLLAILLASAFSRFPHPPQNLDKIYLGNLIGSGIWCKLFTYFNGASFFSSVSGLVLSTCAAFSPLVLPISPVVDRVEVEIAYKRKRLAQTLPKFLYVSMFLILSISSLAVAYVFAALATVRGNMSDQLPVIITCAVGGFVFIQALWVSGRERVQLWREILESHLELWQALKEETVMGHVLTSYMEKMYVKDSETRSSKEDGMAKGEPTL